MGSKKADVEPDIAASPAGADRGESTALMEPMVIPESSPRRAALDDLAIELAQRTAGFKRALPASLVPALATLVRSMNCYYSNLIEGHHTHPVDIERALLGEYSANAAQRDLQLEARAHIRVQQWIDEGGLGAQSTTRAGLCELHRRFCEHLPQELLSVEDPVTHQHLRLVPGELRTRDVQVGNHVAISPGAVPRFMERFEHVYGSLGKNATVIATAAAHHRLLWIHPFLDGNGRVARLMSHATLLNTLDTGAVWSIARGLARNVDAYKAHLAACDLARRNDLDGRGALSEEALLAFSTFLLQACLDQVAFMEGLLQPERLRARIALWAEEEVRLGRLPPKSGAVLEALLYRGELGRAEVAGLVGTGERQARRFIAALTQLGVVSSTSSRAPLRLAFPAGLASRWLPGLFPEQQFPQA
jgi:Fic family protein